IMFIGFMLMTTSPSWFSVSTRLRTMPRSDREREGVASTTVTRTRSTSPGRRRGIDMHVLRVVAPGEFDDLGLGDPDVPIFEDGAGEVILETAVFGSYGEI